MSFARRIDPDELQRLLNAGRSRNECAAHFQVDRTAIHSAIVRHHLREPHRTVRMWSRAELRRAERMARCGVRYAEIARQLGRTEKAVTRAINRRITGQVSGRYVSQGRRRRAGVSEVEAVGLLPQVLAVLRGQYSGMDDDDRASAAHMGVVAVLTNNATASEAMGLAVTVARREAVMMLRSQLGRTGKKIRPRSLVTLTPAENENLCDRSEPAEATVGRTEITRVVTFARTHLIASRLRRVVDRFVRHDSFDEAVSQSGVSENTYRKRLKQAFDALRPKLRGLEP